MIRIRRKGLSLSITGHAGAGKPGEDLVCAAVSALAWTLAANLEALRRPEGLRGYSSASAPGTAGSGCAPPRGGSGRGRWYSERWLWV